MSWPLNQNRQLKVLVYIFWQNYKKQTKKKDIAKNVFRKAIFIHFEVKSVDLLLGDKSLLAAGLYELRSTMFVEVAVINICNRVF